MTIEITLDDLLHLAESAKANGTSVLFLTYSTDNKRVQILVTTAPRRRRSRAKAALKLPTAQGAA